MVVRPTIQKRRRVQSRHLTTKESTAPSLYLLLLFLVLATGIVTAGYLFYRGYARNFHGEVKRGLSSIAELKVGELVQWRKERLGDAGVLHENVTFSDLVRRYFEAPEDAEAQRQLRRG